MSTTGGSQAVDRAATLLALVVESESPRSFTSLVDEAGLAKSTASRLLQALERNRLVQRARDGAFGPGALFVAYAARHDAVQDLVETARPVMERLASATGESVNLAVPRGDVAVAVAQIDSRHLLGVTSWVGVHVPPHCSALSKMLMACDALPVPEEPMTACTQASRVTRTALRRDLDDARRQGWALSWEELEPGLASVAAPVRARRGTAVAALSVAGPTARISRVDVTRLGGLVRTEALRLSALLGHQPDEHNFADAPSGRDAADTGEGAA